MYTLPALYDVIYGFKDYASEAVRIRQYLNLFNRPHARTLLDVACGTGKHLEHLQAHFTVEGLDLDPGLLRIAAERLPGVPLHHADMRTFDLGRQFDVITCLFSAIGYMTTLDDLRRAVSAMAAHLAPGGLLLIEPWLPPDKFHDRKLHLLSADPDPETKIVRITRSRVEEGLSVMYFHYIVATPDGVTLIDETLHMGLYTDDQYRDALAAAGLEVKHDPDGAIGRGMWIGSKPTV
ncbi:MAG: class I SAM-dependent methyltransferase [bacterium]|nr:class I SAM-dependent methyltransferase [bacterium]